ncbi:Uncharacterised protein [Legionella spiritensis]|nr:Uncharacterised protein [Legionella spiritensis]
MELVSQDNLDKYIQRDSILAMLNKISVIDEEQFKSQQWLRQSMPKRYVFEKMYYDLINKSDLKILDVGGGITAFTKIFSKNHHYQLLEIMNHDTVDLINVYHELKELKVIETDWFALESSENYDLVIANDLFPNVDQRLELFLERFIPQCRELRISLTFYNQPRFYNVKRTDADEILCMLAWNANNLHAVLKKFEHCLFNADALSLLYKDNKSVFPNGRQVLIVTFLGDLR